MYWWSISNSNAFISRVMGFFLFYEIRTSCEWISYVCLREYAIGFHCINRYCILKKLCESSVSDAAAAAATAIGIRLTEWVRRANHISFFFVFSFYFSLSCVCDLTTWCYHFSVHCSVCPISRVNWRNIYLLRAFVRVRVKRMQFERVRPMNVTNKKKEKKPRKKCHPRGCMPNGCSLLTCVYCICILIHF